MTTIRALERALAALDGGDDAAALEGLAHAWRKSRAPRLAELAGVIAKRSPSPLAQSLSSLIAPRVAATLARWEALGEVDDPVASTWVLDALASPPFTGPSARPLLEAFVDAAARMRDPRLLERAPAMASAWEVRVTPKAARVALQTRLSRAVAAIGREATPPLDEKSMRLTDAIAARLSRETKSAHTLEELYADVYANPDDDAPRLVLADALLERGDPRGELIALQFKRRDGALDDAGHAREKALLKAHGKAWLGPLAPIISWGKGYSGSTFERGFLCVADIILSVGKKAQLLLDEPSWATVEELEGNWPHELLERPQLRALRRVSSTFTVEKLRALSRPIPLEEIELYPPLEGLAEVVARALPRLKKLSLTMLVADITEQVLASLLAAPTASLVLGAIWRDNEREQLAAVQAMAERLVAADRSKCIGEITLMAIRYAGEAVPIVLRRLGKSA